MGKYKNAIVGWVTARQGSGGWAKYRGRTFEQLYDLVRNGRNEAVHQGVFARNLGDLAVELAIALEEILVKGKKSIGDFMVSAPVQAQLWQPLRLVRHQMLANSFSFLPIQVGDGEDSWKVISDLEVARCLDQAGSRTAREKRLATTIEELAHAEGTPLRLDKADVRSGDALVSDVLKTSTHLPILVVDKDQHLIGIVTAFDLL